MYILETKLIEKYREWLRQMEKSAGTAKKYVRDILALYAYLPEDKQLSWEVMQGWKSHLLERQLSIGTINTILTAVTGFFRFLGWIELLMRQFRRQRKIFRDTERELSREEYIRLVQTAERLGKNRLSLVMQSICATGIRISELRYLTVEAVKQGRAEVNCKGKVRVVLIPSELKRRLLCWIRQEKIASGPIFITKKGRPLDRSNVWHEMKKLCEKADVAGKKVFPHNLRHLFAVTFYRKQKDLAKLADILGHSSVETTRIYAMESGEEHRKMLNQLRLIL